jgi:hypothetical protein
MKTIYNTFFILILSSSSVFCQVTVDIRYHDNREVENGLYGFHMSNFFESCKCYDPDSIGGGNDTIDLCMQMAANLKPRVLRFPAGGDHKYYHLLDSNGYGRRYADVDSFFTQGWLKAAQMAAFNQEVYRQDSLYDGIRFLDRLIDFTEYCEEENGYKPDVIFVANIIAAKYNEDIYDENMAVLHYLHDAGINIVGIELGNEHYDDKDTAGHAIFRQGTDLMKPSFNNYWNTCMPMLTRLSEDSVFWNVPVALVAAPEPIHGEATGIEEPKLSYYKGWNYNLKMRATTAPYDTTFDAFVVHVYQRPADMPACYDLYIEDYILGGDSVLPSMDDGFNVELSPLDTAIIPAWECARDSFGVYTNETLRNIMNQWAGSCDSCLGNSKPYWMTEWGFFGDEWDTIVYTIDTIILQGSSVYDTIEVQEVELGLDFGNTFVDAAYAFQFLLEMTDYQAVLGGPRLADIEYMFKHNYVSKTPGGAINQPFGLDDPSSLFIRRAHYWPFFMIREIFNKGYERIKTTMVPLDGETREPFIKCFYYDNPSTIVLPTSLCDEFPSGTTNPVFYMYYYNPYPDDITFKHEEMTGTNNETLETFTPASGNAAFAKSLDVNQLYRHAGMNRYVQHNPYYQGTLVEPDITGLSSEVFELCNGDSIMLRGYSLGYIYWEITPEPNRVGLFEYISLKTWPVPAHQEVYLQADLPNGTTVYQYKIFSISGQLMAQGIFPESGYLPLSRNQMTAGLYLFQLTTTSGELVGQSKVLWE